MFLKIINIAAVCVLASPVIVVAQSFPDVIVETRPLIESMEFDRTQVEEQIRRRLESGIYADYTVDLGVDDPMRCEDPAFESYKTENDGAAKYSLRLKKDQWKSLEAKVQDAVIAEIIYYTWGHKNNKRPVFAVSPKSEAEGPLELLSPHLNSLYLTYSQSTYLQGGLGTHAYGPNCWYTSIAAVAANGSWYAKKRQLESSGWNEHRFMGATEFRFHMRNFEEVGSPQFGDIVRYYTDKELFYGDVSSGELHAAIYVGREITIDDYGTSHSRAIVLSKNGRRDTDFLKFQDLESLDSQYLNPIPETHKLIELGGGVDPRKRGFFRLRDGSRILDPKEANEESAAYPAFLVDKMNYTDRWDCLAGKIQPPPGENTSAYSYPERWTTIQWLSKPRDE
ncbi:hypothetical protein [Planctomicrobium piriforme]|uniref:Uncharacterized protein n=1 Tax=Planctomicrobium piriforme TaxID=1576369 RepID=A0A1I3TM00_9PLAN|nr:hypothetical protein [Planctomicrobium piriforme]SFJ71553.1 hypothetical protein SAMN05421753_1341 [Planctomicrobium piriforme]